MHRFVTRFVSTVLMAAIAAAPVFAQQKEIKIGVIYDFIGPIAIGTRNAIELMNDRGGVGGYKIKAIYADARSTDEVGDERNRAPA